MGEAEMLEKTWEMTSAYASLALFGTCWRVGIRTLKMSSQSGRGGASGGRKAGAWAVPEGGEEGGGAAGVRVEGATRAPPYFEALPGALRWQPR